MKQAQIEWNGYRTFIWPTQTNLGLRWSFCCFVKMIILVWVWFTWLHGSFQVERLCWQVFIFSHLWVYYLWLGMVFGSRQMLLASFIDMFYSSCEGNTSLFHILKDRGVVGLPLESLFCAIHVDLPMHSKLNWLYYLIIYDKRL